MGLWSLTTHPTIRPKAKRRQQVQCVKGEMQEWLRAHNLAFEENTNKRELYQIILRIKPQKRYFFHKLLNTHGHKALRLPPYHCDLNLIEYNYMEFGETEGGRQNVNQSEKEIKKRGTL